MNHWQDVQTRSRCLGTRFVSSQFNMMIPSGQTPIFNCVSARGSILYPDFTSWLNPPHTDCQEVPDGGQRPDSDFFASCVFPVFCSAVVRVSCSLGRVLAATFSQSCSVTARRQKVELAYRPWRQLLAQSCGSKWRILTRVGDTGFSAGTLFQAQSGETRERQQRRQYKLIRDKLSSRKYWT